MAYHTEGGGESSLQLSDPAANETTLTDLQCSTNYTITVVATAEEYRREGVTSIVLQGITFVCIYLISLRRYMQMVSFSITISITQIDVSQLE